jgi:hypothetical protein
MANLTEAANYDAGVYQLEISDPVQGGANGIANAPLKNLANRTAYLKLHLDNIESGAFLPPGLARVDSQTFTGTPRVPTPPVGDNSTLISNTQFVQQTVNGVLTKNVAGAANVTLLATEAGYPILIFTGALTGNIAVIVPGATGNWVVINRTTGAFTLTVKTAAGTGVAVTQGKSIELTCDGTNVVQSTTDFVNTALTGAPTAPAAPIGDNSTLIADTSWVQNTVSGVVSVNVAGGADVTLTQAQWGYGIILLTGALTANINVILPTQNDQWIFCNKTTGAYTVTLKTAAGTGSPIQQGNSVVAYCDGTNIALAGSTPAASFTPTPFTATAGQTTFSVQYTPGNIMVARNGSLLRPSDYTATSGTQIVLATAAAANDQIDVYAFASIVISNALTQGVADGRYALQNNGQLNKPTIKGYIEQLQSLTGASVTVDPTLGTMVMITLSADTTITLPTPVDGMCFVLILSYSGAYTPTFAGGGTLRWANGNVVPTPTKVSGKIDKYVFTCASGITMGQDGGRNF